MYGAADDIPEEREPIVGADRHEVRPGLRIVVSGQTNCAAVMLPRLVKQRSPPSARRLHISGDVERRNDSAVAVAAPGDDVALW